jgi:hypothetical protein
MSKPNLTAYDHAVLLASRAGVAAAAPEETHFLEDLLEPPPRRLPWQRSRPLDVGVSDVVDYVSPIAIAATLWYGGILFDEAKSVVEGRTRDLVRRLLSRRGTGEGAAPDRPAPVAPIALTPAQRKAHVALVKRYAIPLGLDEQRAEVLARAIVGSMADGA